MTENPFKSGHTMCTFGVKSNDRRGVGLPLMKGQSVKSQARFVESKGSIPRACSPTSMSRQSTPDGDSKNAKGFRPGVTKSLGEERVGCMSE